MSSSFDPETLNLLDETEEVYIETTRDADSPEHRTIIWAVVVGREVFVRSVQAEKGRWYQRISAHPEGALLVGDTRIPVRAAPANDAVTVDAVSEAFRSKYEEAWPGPTAGIVRSEVLPTTLKLTPAWETLMPRFVIQEHYARSHHFDLRLERNGVLVSWAVPKGMPTDTKKNRLAMRVDNHDMSHLDVVDETPVEGVPGAVAKSIWDRGTYEAEQFDDEMVIVAIHGERLDGRYAIFRTGGTNWLVHLMKDEDRDPGH
jgi:DNA ligase D-like protein (predicted 3'-phosphoesterase)